MGVKVRLLFYFIWYRFYYVRHKNQKETPPNPPQKKKRKIQAKLPDRDETQGVSTWQWWDMRDEHGIRLMS